MIEDEHFVNEAMRKAICARLLELYDRYGTFQVRGVEPAMDLLFNENAPTPEEMGEIIRDRLFKRRN